MNIQVDPVVSMWANDNNIQLTMNGADANNSATAASSLSIINNVDANVTAKVDGSLPTPIVSGGGINFFIFKDVTPAQAVGAITAVKEAGLEIPKDVAIVGFDDIPLAVHTSPPLTTVRQPMRQQGQIAAELLLERIREDEDTERNETVLDCELVIRGSSVAS